MTFAESFATICIERGIYFFSHDRLGFGDTDNLWLALVLGVAYVVGALSSHSISQRMTERTLLLLAIAGQTVTHLALAAWPVAATLFIGSAMIGLFNGVKWPLLESFVSAGKEPLHQARSVGHFNMAWSSAVPLALAAVGPMIACGPLHMGGLAMGAGTIVFLVPAAINLLCITLCASLPTRPVHLPVDHAARPSAVQLDKLESLLSANRWLMVASYITLFLLAPLLPSILARLGTEPTISPALSGILDVVRLLAFFLLGRWSFWHGRVSPVLAGMVMMPAGFFMILLAANMGVVLAGELLFGLAAGIVYYGSLYYAMLVKNASVEGGGAHEGLIGLGFAIGPALGLASAALYPLIRGSVADNWQAQLVSQIISIGPILTACTAAAVVALLKAARHGRRELGS